MPQITRLISSVALVGCLSSGCAIGTALPAIAATSPTVKTETVQCPAGTVYRSGSENHCQQPSLVDVCLHADRHGQCGETLDSSKEYHPPADIVGPSRSQGSGTRNKPH